MSKNIHIEQAEEEARTRSPSIRFGMSYEVEVRDKDGNLLSKCEGKHDPLTRAWLRMLRSMFTCALSVADVVVTLTDTGGTGRDFYSSVSAGYVCIPISCNAGATTETYGVRVGSSTTAFDKAQYELLARIAHGSGAGQLNYGATTVEDYVDEDSTTRFRIIRPFSNNSGNAVTVNEIGIAIANYNTKTSPNQRNYLIARDVLSSPQSVPDLATLTVTYRGFISYA